MPSRVPVVDRCVLEGMHTGSLLTRLRGLQQCEESFELSDRVDLEAAPDPSATGYIEFKNSPAWSTAFHELKEILSGRGHMPTAAERKELRERKGL